jgi:putative transposase
MIFDKHHRRTIRLPGYDYSQSGSYYLTICVQNSERLLGDIQNGKMNLNEAGQMIESIWHELPVFYSGVNLDSLQIMPDHLHGIIVLGHFSAEGQPQGVAPTLSFPDLVYRFKSLTTKRYADGVRQNGWPPFTGRLWQRNYYEHIIRNQIELEKIREYIRQNPRNWDHDL